MKYEVPIWEKANLTLEEAAAYFGIGINKIRQLTNEKTARLYCGAAAKDSSSERLWRIIFQKNIPYSWCFAMGKRWTKRTSRGIIHLSVFSLLLL